MRRTLTLAALTGGAVLAMGGTAAANVGDVVSVTTEGALTGTPNSVTVQGSITCAESLRYGLVVQAVQTAENTGPGDTGTRGASVRAATHEGTADGTLVNRAGNYPTESVAAFGPAILDNGTCNQSERSFDVVVEQNVGSQQFQDGTVGVFVAGNTSANNGNRGPGPFVGDVYNYYAVSSLAVE